MTPMDKIIHEMDPSLMSLKMVVGVAEDATVLFEVVGTTQSIRFVQEAVEERDRLREELAQLEKDWRTPR